MTSPGTRHSAGPPESEIRFSLRHFVLSEIKGRVGRWSASVLLDLRQPDRSTVEVVIDAGSFDTGDVERDDQIRSSEFLDARSFPEIRFRSRSIRAEPDARTYVVSGELTIRGVALPLAVTVRRDEAAAAAGSETLLFTGHAIVDRQEYGLHWNQDLDRGGFVVGDKIDVELRAVLVPSSREIIQRAQALAPGEPSASR